MRPVFEVSKVGTVSEESCVSNVNMFNIIASGAAAIINTSHLGFTLITYTYNAALYQLI